MTKEDKELLLKDLSARLPYGVKVQINSDIKKVVGVKNNFVVTKERGIFSTKEYITRIECCKPYLRPMSSMTEEEKREYNLTKTLSIVDYPTLESFDWLLAHHFDFRNLIEHGLAIAVTEENNPYKS